MKLLSCHIENFGTLSGVDQLFSEGWNEFSQNNGTGKTTLCEFIKAMLYGMPTVRGDRIQARTHYYPFSGGKFGGNLVLERGGKIYRIERFFDKRSEKKDELKVYCNDKEINCQLVGNTLFGLNEDSFERIIFFRSEDISADVDEEIVLKLNQAIQNTDGEALERAMFLLGKAKKNYRADRGNNDEITHTQALLSQLDQKLAEAENARDSLKKAHFRFRDLEKRIPELEREEIAVQGKKVDCERYSYYKSALDEQDSVLQSQNKLYARFPKGLPTEEELKEISRIEREEIFYQAKKSELHFNELTEWEQLNSRYGKNEPTNEMIASVKQDRDELVVLESKISAFANGQTFQYKKRFTKVPYLILLLLSVVAIGVGMSLWNFSYTQIATYTLAGGAGLFLLNALLFFVHSIKVSLKNKAKERVTREELVSQAEKIRSSLKDFFHSYGLSGNEKDLLDTLKGELVAFHALSAEKSDKERREKEFSSLLQENKNRLEEIYRKYELTNENSTFLTEAKMEENRIQAALKILNEKVDKYKTEPVSYSEEEEALIRTELQNSRREYIELKTQIDQMEDIADKVDLYRSERECAIQHLSDCLKKESILLKTISLLNESEESLRSRYVSPVKKTFVEYADTIRRVQQVKISLDENLSVSFEKNGEKRTEEYLSSGERTSAILCMRLALLDGLYAADKPFLLFDDPFMTLDEEALKRVFALLKEVAKNKQILYFTCHPSRKNV